MKNKNIEVGEGSMFFIPNSDAESDYSEHEEPSSFVNTPKTQQIAAEKLKKEELEKKKEVVVEKLSEFDEMVRKEGHKRNRHPQKLNMQLHPSWTTRIRTDLQQKLILKEGYKGTHVKLSIGDTQIIPEVIKAQGKVPKRIRIDPKDKKKHKKAERNALMKNLGSIEFTGNKIKFH